MFLASQNEIRCSCGMGKSARIGELPRDHKVNSRNLTVRPRMCYWQCGILMQPFRVSISRPSQSYTEKPCNMHRNHTKLLNTYPPQPLSLRNTSIPGRTTLASPNSVKRSSNIQTSKPLPARHTTGSLGL